MYMVFCYEVKGLGIYLYVYNVKRLYCICNVLCRYNKQIKQTKWCIVLVDLTLHTLLINHFICHVSNILFIHISFCYHKQEAALERG
jgi:hypothetical protein